VYIKARRQGGGAPLLLNRGKCERDIAPGEEIKFTKESLHRTAFESGFILLLFCFQESGVDPRRLDMSERNGSEMISRRRLFSLLGLAAALGVAVPPAILMVSDAEAQTVGMERRHERREERRGRRYERREERGERRHERREYRQERREERRS
jgi:hypothetical protein